MIAWGSHSTQLDDKPWMIWQSEKYGDLPVRYVELPDGKMMGIRYIRFLYVML